MSRRSCQEGSRRGNAVVARAKRCQHVASRHMRQHCGPVGSASLSASLFEAGMVLGERTALSRFLELHS